VSPEKSERRFVGAVPDHPRSIPIGVLMSRVKWGGFVLSRDYKGLSVVFSPKSSRMSPSILGVFVLATRGAVGDEAGDSSVVKDNTMTAVRQAVCTGVRNVRALTRVSLHPIP